MTVEEEFVHLTKCDQSSNVVYDASFVFGNQMVQFRSGETAQIAAFKTRGQTGSIVWYGNVLGQSPSTTKLWVCKVPQWMLSGYVTQVDEASHVLHDTWEPSDRFCAVSASSLVALGETAVKSRLRRYNNLTQCFYNGLSNKWVSMPTSTHAPTPTSTPASTPAPTSTPNALSQNGKQKRPLFFSDTSDTSDTSNTSNTDLYVLLPHVPAPPPASMSTHMSPSMVSTSISSPIALSTGKNTKEFPIFFPVLTCILVSLVLLLYHVFTMYHVPTHVSTSTPTDQTDDGKSNTQLYFFFI